MRRNSKGRTTSRNGGQGGNQQERGTRGQPAGTGYKGATSRNGGQGDNQQERGTRGQYGALDCDTEIDDIV